MFNSNREVCIRLGASTSSLVGVGVTKRTLTMVWVLVVGWSPIHTYVRTATCVLRTDTYCYVVRTATYIRTYIHTCVHTTYIRTYIHAYIHTYIRTYIHSYIHRCIMHTYIHIYIHTYTHTYIHMYIHTYINTPKHTPIHTCIHTYTYTYTHTYVRTATYVPLTATYCYMLPTATYCYVVRTATYTYIRTYYIRTYIHTSTHTYPYPHTYIHTYRHPCIHTYIPNQLWGTKPTPGHLKVWYLLVLYYVVLTRVLHPVDARVMQMKPPGEHREPSRSTPPPTRVTEDAEENTEND
jgi:hypothetical protein